MDHIDEHLATAALSPNYPLAIKVALAIGKTTLNRYYNKTDHSEVFWIAMGMISLTIELTPLTTFLSQFYTLNTSWTTLKELGGKNFELRALRNLCILSSSSCISTWTMIFGPQVILWYIY
jgi:hypothetical protein